MCDKNCCSIRSSHQLDIMTANDDPYNRRRTRDHQISLSHRLLVISVDCGLYLTVTKPPSTGAAYMRDPRTDLQNIT